MDHDLDAVLDQIDEIEEDLDGHEEKIVALDRLAATADHGSPGWAELVVTAADHRSLIGEHQSALEQLEQVRASGVVVEPSIEARLITAHLGAGNESAAAELERKLRTRSREAHLDQDYSWVGEAYEEAGRLKEALRWFTMANRDVDPDDLDLLEPLALYGRLRVRQALGLPADAYDESAMVMLEQDRARWAAENS